VDLISIHKNIIDAKIIHNLTTDFALIKHLIYKRARSIIVRLIYTTDVKKMVKHLYFSKLPYNTDNINLVELIMIIPLPLKFQSNK